MLMRMAAEHGHDPWAGLPSELLSCIVPEPARGLFLGSFVDDRDHASHRVLDEYGRLLQAELVGAQVSNARLGPAGVENEGGDGLLLAVNPLGEPVRSGLGRCVCRVGVG